MATEREANFHRSFSIDKFSNALCRPFQTSSILNNSPSLPIARDAHYGLTHVAPSFPIARYAHYGLTRVAPSGTQFHFLG